MTKPLYVQQFGRALRSQPWHDARNDPCDEWSIAIVLEWSLERAWPAIGDLVRYDWGPTGLMRVTHDQGDRIYGRAFHSSGTCTSRHRKAITRPSDIDKQRWAYCHNDVTDEWVRGRWGVLPGERKDMLTR